MGWVGAAMLWVGEAILLANIVTRCIEIDEVRVARPEGRPQMRLVSDGRIGED
jgi:hypothetical protein